MDRVDIDAKITDLVNKLVPDSGKASSVNGEILRALTRIEYELYTNSNGNVRDNPYYNTLWTKLKRFIDKNKETGTDIMKRVEEIKPTVALGKRVRNYGIPEYIKDAFYYIKEWIIKFIENNPNDRKQIPATEDEDLENKISSKW